jgi:membrane-associated phospholipid phosphatase
MEVYQTSKTLTDEQKSIARFWSDDAMLTFTPPGHWTAILTQVAVERSLSLTDHVEALARMGIAMADAFIGCWVSKFEYDLIRPVTYIKKVIDPKWEPMLTTPPFPEYPSGHSTQSGAAAALLTHLFGEAYSFTDESPTPDGSPKRSFASFWAASDEAAISRLYGGIHFRHAIEQGQVQGRCIAQYAIDLKTRA